MLRRILVVTQFTIAIVFIISSIAMVRQMQYIRNRNLGFDRDNVVILPMNQGIRKNYPAFKNEVLQNPGIANVTSATGIPTSIGNINPVYWEGRGPDQYETMNFVSVDYDYIKTFNMKIVKGRDFSRDFSTDPKNYIVNEEAVKFMKMENPIGKLFSIWQDEGKIIGIVKNFHSRSLHNEIVPLVLTLSKNWRHSRIFMKITPGNIPAIIQYLNTKWSKFAPGYPFSYRFLDDVFHQQYRTDRRVSTIFEYFTYFTIFISCLGLFGLASYLVERRTKEIGIRKTLGASVSNIIALISKEFVVLLTIANIIAWPVAYFIMQRMLNDYSYRAPLTPWILAAAGVLAFALALLTVSYQSIKAARGNPVNALKYE